VTDNSDRGRSQRLSSEEEREMVTAWRQGDPGALRQLVDSVDLQWEAYGWTVSHLTGTSNSNLGRYKRFTDTQIDVVTAFLQRVRTAGGFEGKMAAEGLAKYWETPEARRRTIIHLA